MGYFMKTPNVIFMDFSNLYESAAHVLVAKNYSVERIDCSGIPGTNCYCDEAAKAELRRMIADYSPHGVHFLDSGNYHYLSLLWLEKLKEDFLLLLLDNHPDMQQSAFGNITSCGGWVREALENPSLRQAVLAGVDESLLAEIKPLPENVTPVQGTLEAIRALCALRPELFQLPIYISLDKDVLSPEYARCDWSQGKMSRTELLSILQYLNANTRILGIDICGEKKDNATPEDIRLNEETNQILLNCGIMDA